MMATTSTNPNLPPPPAGKRIMTKVYRGTLPPGVSLNDAYDQWLQYVWIEGGGLSITKPPIVLEQATDPASGQGLLREIPPTGIQEKIVAADRTAGVVKYKVMNPGAKTYQVYWHEGTVQWTKGATPQDGLGVEWTVAIVPWFGWGWFVGLMAKFVVGKELLPKYIAHVTKTAEASK